MRYLAVLLALAVSTGCESQQKKAERLRFQMSVDCLAVDVGHVTPENQAKCDIATANYRKAVEGR